MLAFGAGDPGSNPGRATLIWGLTIPDVSETLPLNLWRDQIAQGSVGYTIPLKGAFARVRRERLSQRLGRDNQGCEIRRLCLEP